MQAFLGKQGKYLEANEVKRIADRMEHMELEATLAAYAAEVAIKEQALRAKQQNEMEVLLQRAAQGRDDLRKTRALDLERCTQVTCWNPFDSFSSFVFPSYYMHDCIMRLFLLLLSFVGTCTKSI